MNKPFGMFGTKYNGTSTIGTRAYAFSIVPASRQTRN